MGHTGCHLVLVSHPLCAGATEAQRCKTQDSQAMGTQVWPECRQLESRCAAAAGPVFVCVCTHISVCTLIARREGSTPGYILVLPGPLSPDLGKHRLPLIMGLSGPSAQPRLPTLERFSGYCNSAFPSIRILLHSCESFSKQTV